MSISTSVAMGCARTNAKPASIDIGVKTPSILAACFAGKDCRYDTVGSVIGRRSSGVFIQCWAGPLLPPRTAAIRLNAREPSIPSCSVVTVRFDFRGGFRSVTRCPDAKLPSPKSGSGVGFVRPGSASSLKRTTGVSRTCLVSPVVLFRLLLVPVPSFPALPPFPFPIPKSVLPPLGREGSCIYSNWLESCDIVFSVPLILPSKFQPLRKIAQAQELRL